MALPGITITISDSAPPRTIPTDTGISFVVGITEKGPTAATLLRSMHDYTAVYGNYFSSGRVYDSLDVYFREGGSQAYVARVVGPGAVYASHMLLDGSSGNTLLVKAKNPGAGGNSLKIAVLAGDAGGEFKLQVTDGTTIVETSPSLVDKAAALAWVLTSGYITLTDQASTLDPAVVAATSLSSGADDLTNVTDNDWKLAAGRFSRDLGPGQIWAPGRTSDQAHLDLLAHAASNRRVAILDGADTASASTLATAADALRGDGRWGGLFAPWIVVPGRVDNTRRVMPPSPMIAGMIARNDAAGNANIASAGSAGHARYAVGVTQTYTDDDRETLNDAGVNVTISNIGGVQNYGFRSLANPVSDPNNVQLTGARAVMGIAAEAEKIGAGYVFAQLDGRGITINAFGGELAAMLTRFFNLGALFGATTDAAFAVDVGPDVNTPTTIQNGELHAVLTVRISPFGETVEIELVKRPVTENV